MTSSQKLTFAGVDITQPPYNANMTMAAKYWWLDAFTSQQYPTGPRSLVSSKSRIKDWLISVELRIIDSECSRAGMLASVIALAGLFNPMAGEQELIFDEFPCSFFLAKRQSSHVSKESASPYIIELQYDFACTGPAYDTTESTDPEDISSGTNMFTITSECDPYTYADPLYRFTASSDYSGNITLLNSTTGESLVWNGSLASGDVLDFNLNLDYGIGHQVYKNGNVAMATLIGPAWPHLTSGANSMAFIGPAGSLLTKWRDRFLVGKQ